MSGLNRRHKRNFSYWATESCDWVIRDWWNY